MCDTQRVHERGVMKKTTITKTLKCKLTDVEWVDRANELANRLSDFKRMEERHKNTRADMKAEKENASKFIGDLVDALKTSEEEREVKCEVMPDLKKDEIVTVRLDTKDEIERRPMTQAEVKKQHQGDLALDPKPAKRQKKNSRKATHPPVEAP